jgi:putative acetyltransferase
MRRAAGPGLRPYLPTDARSLVQIFRASVETLAAEDYDDDQRAAWAAAADDEAGFDARLGGALTLVALLDGSIAGFASLQDNKNLDMLYVRPDCARRGVGSALVEALERLAAGRGAKILSVEAADSARDFFLRRGYVPQSRNTRMIGGQWLGNTTMTKELAPAATGGPH